MGDMEDHPVIEGNNDMTTATAQSSEEPSPSTPQSSQPTTANMDELADRYNKLKGIALKLKKRIADQTTEIETLKEDKARFQNASKIQQEFDKAQDEIEKLKKSESTLKKDLEKSIEENVNLKMANAEATSQVQSLSASHKAIREKLEKFEKDTENVEELKEKAERLERELQEAKTAGIDAQQEKRQLQILSLEVTDYEKKLADAYGCIEEKKAEYEGLLKELDGKDGKIQELESQIMDCKKVEDQLTLAKESFQVKNPPILIVAASWLEYQFLITKFVLRNFFRLKFFAKQRKSAFFRKKLLNLQRDFLKKNPSSRNLNKNTATQRWLIMLKSGNC
jgi:DNA repair exonuclease SbcCD ATPase subunit